MRKNKKGQIGDVIGSLFPIVVVLIIIGIVATIGLLILRESRDVLVDQGDIVRILVANETITVANNTFVSLTKNGRALLTCEAVINNSIGGGALIDSSNYTCTIGQGISIINGSAVGNGNGSVDPSVNVTYTYSDGGPGYNATESTQESINEIPGWLAIIVIVLIGGILISLTSMFRNR